MERRKAPASELFSCPGLVLSEKCHPFSWALETRWWLMNRKANNKEAVVSGWLSATQRSISDSSRLQEKLPRCMGSARGRLPACRKFQLLLLSFFFLNSSFNHSRTQMQSEAEARSRCPLCVALFPLLLSGYFRAMLTDYMAICLLKRCEIEHCTLNSCGPTRKSRVKSGLSNCRWSIFHSLITEHLLLNNRRWSWAPTPPALIAKQRG